MKIEELEYLMKNADSIILSNGDLDERITRHYVYDADSIASDWNDEFALLLVWESGDHAEQFVYLTKEEFEAWLFSLKFL